MFTLSNEGREIQETDLLTSMLQFSVISRTPKYGVFLGLFFFWGGGSRGCLKITR